jgi:NAD(P)-dependent dehydrogenase (short-subunit alcohol dehydrogenase family)/acyl dehydratase
VSRPLSLTEDHLQRFAAASGDRNPLHVDELFARGTPQGRCIAHGALVVVSALGAADADALRRAEALDIQFRQPVFPSEEYAASLAESTKKSARIEVIGAGRRVATVVVTIDREQPPLPDVGGREQRAEAAPRIYALDQLVGADISISERYAPDLQALSELAHELDAGHIPDAILTWLAAASYTVGMLVPGRDALFARAQLARTSSREVSRITASVSAADERTGFVSLDAVLEQAEVSAQMTLHTFLRSPVPAPDRSRLAPHLAPSTALAGRKILVVGASRGLGAAVTGAFATQGATVWAGFAQSTEKAERLRQEFGEDRVRLLQFNAEDPEQARHAFDTVRAQAGALDGVVLSAAPPLGDLALHPASAGAMLEFLDSSMAMMLVPLSEALRLLTADGWLVIVSSSALDDPPESWPHYVTAKAAQEGAAAYCALHTSARVLVARPPKMWTESTNTPMGRIGAVEKEHVAAAIVRWVMHEAPKDGLQLLTSEQLMDGPPLQAAPPSQSSTRAG